MRSGGEKRRLGRSNSHPHDRESCLTSELSIRWRACKLPHCAIDPGGRERSVLSLGDARQETCLGVGLLKKIVAGKKEFIGRSYENCRFQRRNSAVHRLLRRRRRRHSNSTWNWFHVFSYERLFSFCYWWGILYSPSSFIYIYIYIIV